MAKYRRRDRVRAHRAARPHVVYVTGARPNFVKIAPVVRAMRRALPNGRHTLVHTGQHYDREMAGVFIEELALAEPAYVLDVGSGTHGVQTARVLERVEGVLAHERPDVVVVPGDVNSTLGAALAAAKLGIPIAHIESGLRSFDRTMPEEINRVLVDQLARWCFTHSAEADENLRREGVGEDRIVFSGNTMIDTLVSMRDRVSESEILDRLRLTPREYALVTLHRPALVDGVLLDDVMSRLEIIGSTLPVVFPVHPRTAPRIRARTRSSMIRLVEPLGYVDFVALEAGAAAVITDSGGVQEETTYLRVPCFTLRANTERPVTVRQGTNRILGLPPLGLERVPELIAEIALPLAPPPGWDGHAAERVAAALVGELAGGADADRAVASAQTAEGE